MPDKIPDYRSELYRQYADAHKTSAAEQTRRVRAARLDLKHALARAEHLGRRNFPAMLHRLHKEDCAAIIAAGNADRAQLHTVYKDKIHQKFSAWPRVHTSQAHPIFSYPVFPPLWGRAEAEAANVVTTQSDQRGKARVLPGMLARN